MSGCVIQSVVVYRDRAEVKRIVHATLAAGENEVLVTGLAECMDKNSVRYRIIQYGNRTIISFLII